jgi:hypothetical protein
MTVFLMLKDYDGKLTNLLNKFHDTQKLVMEQMSYIDSTHVKDFNTLEVQYEKVESIQPQSLTIIPTYGTKE